MDTQKKEVIKRASVTVIFMMIVGVVISIVIRYQVNGEKNMPCKISKISVISTASGQEKEEESEENNWDLTVSQNNDIYVYIESNNEEKNTVNISSATIENITVTKQPIKGKIKGYMPNSGENGKFINSKEFEIEKSLTYIGSKASNEKTLEIGKQGGLVLFRISNTDIGTYISNEDTQVVHDGTLIKKIDTTNEEIVFSASFDLIIDTGKIKYKAKINLDLPNGNILEEGTSKIENLDLSNIIFKRI